jgi:hypothetical protein
MSANVTIESYFNTVSHTNGLGLVHNSSKFQNEVLSPFSTVEEKFPHIHNENTQIRNPTAVCSTMCDTYFLVGRGQVWMHDAHKHLVSW